MRNLRIWHYWNGCHTKLTLIPGKPINIHRYETTDEGYSFEQDNILLGEDGRVTMESVDDGRDCDGRLTRESHYVMDGLTRIEVEQEPTAVMQRAGIEASWSVMVPNWMKARSTQRDEYAEAAGY